MREVVDLQMLLHLIRCLYPAEERRCHEACRAYHHIDTARRCVVNEFRRELAHGPQVGKVAFLSVDEVVAVACAQVLDVVDGEDVGGVLDEEDELAAAGGEVVYDGGADAGGAALEE